MASLAGISRGSHAAFFIARRALEAGGAGGRRPGKQATRRRFIAIECATDETELADPPLDHHVVTYPYGATQNLRLAIDAAGVALWSWNVDNDKLTMDEPGYRLWGVPISAFVTFDDLSSHIHPADRDRVRAAFAATRAISGAYEIDFRIMVGDAVRWISARGQGEDVGMVGRVMFGIFIDVTGRKQAEEGHELLAGEMSHRVKNLLAIASGLTSITSRSAKRTEDMARELIQRLTALLYDHVSGDRFRHGTGFVRWRPDKSPRQCTSEQIVQRSAGSSRISRGG